MGIRLQTGRRKGSQEELRVLSSPLLQRPVTIPGHEADRLRLLCAKVKIKWSCNSTSLPVSLWLSV